MSESIPRLLTVGVIAQQCGVPLHKVEYLIKARGIKPLGMAGHSRVFTEADAERIAAELQRMKPAVDPRG